jgi:hypothetical protein
MNDRALAGGRGIMDGDGRSHDIDERAFVAVQ